MEFMKDLISFKSSMIVAICLLVNIGEILDFDGVASLAHVRAGLSPRDE